MSIDFPLFAEVRRGWKLARKLFEPVDIDNFAGGGGVAMGYEMATGRAFDHAVNHDVESVEMHAVNHPGTAHHCESVCDVDLAELCGNSRFRLAWFSPDCTHFSNALGGKPVSKSVRGLAWIAIKYARMPRHRRPLIIGLENVREFTGWGPLTSERRPCPKRKGQTFNRFVAALKRYGYAVEWRVLDSAAYGAPTQRKRFFLFARCDGRPIVWPSATHGPRGSGLKRYRTAADCLDWSLPCVGRVRSENIATRIKVEGAKYPGKPWIMSYYGSGGNRSVHRPLPTITTRDRFALVMPNGSMRMLTVRELARCQGFPDTYVLTGTVESQKARIGNSVPPHLVAALLRANLQTNYAKVAV